MKDTKYIVLFFFLTTIGLFSNPVIVDSLTMKKDTILTKQDTVIKNVKNEDEIKIPKFDINLSFYDILVINIGARALILKYLSLDYSYGFVLAETGGQIQRYGLNFHFPFFHDLALSSIITYNYHPEDISHDCGYYYNKTNFSLNLSYLPIKVKRFNFNCRIGIEQWYYSRDIFEIHGKERKIHFSFDFGCSFSFP